VTYGAMAMRQLAGLALGRVARRLRRAWLARSGVAAVEFAIGASFVLLASTGIYDFGRAYWTRIQVMSALHSAAAYAATNGFNSNGIVASMTSSTNFAAISATPAPAQVCGCPNGNTGLTVVACGTACGSGADAGTYVQISVRGTHAFLFPMPGMGSSLDINATAFARIQ
jgi:Flp pilus assembly protein TadG